MKFKEEEIQKINETIGKVEKECGAEIVPVIVKRSDDYPGARWRFILTFSFIFSFFLIFFVKNLSPLGLLVFQFIFLYINYFLSLIPGLHRIFFVSYKIKEEVHQRALSAFLDYGVHQTKNRNGILIMISLLERRAEILCDIGINKKISKDSWQSILNALIQAIRENRLIEGMEEALISCGKLVKKYYPEEMKKTNELRNKLLILDN